MSTISPRAPHTLKTRRANASTYNAGEPLGRYTDPGGRQRELVRRSGAAGSTLVLDRLARTLTDARLVAHLAADEPQENAQIVASLYLAEREGARRCRLLTAEDLQSAQYAPVESRAAIEPKGAGGAAGEQLVDRHGRGYRLALARCGTAISELRWQRHPPDGEYGCPQVVTVREVIGSLESYEPVRALTAQAVKAHATDRAVSVVVLRAELARVCESCVLLNRGLREAVLAAIGKRGLTMSEIAIRCGRCKRDVRGNLSGETSWLARRIGTLPEHGKKAPTPWISSDVLALIARDGLDVCPREVELQ